MAATELLIQAGKAILSSVPRGIKPSPLSRLLIRAIAVMIADEANTMLAGERRGFAATMVKEIAGEQFPESEESDYTGAQQIAADIARRLQAAVDAIVG